MELLSLEKLPTTAPATSAGRGAFTGAVSIGVHALALGAVLALPLVLEQPLPEPAGAARAFLAEPVRLAPPPPPPPPAAAAPRALPRVPEPRLADAGLVAPVEVPSEILPEDDLALGLEGGLPGGVEGGVPGGVVGGVVGGLPEAPPPPGPLRVGRDIRAPRRLKEVAPVYPELARAARVQGVVVLECVIDERGRVQDAKVVKGVHLLDRAALDAVRQWAYAPTLLNGVPVPVLMNLTVTFALEDR